MAPSYYELLKVQPTASEGELRSAYRRAAKQAHPDKGGSDQQFAEVQAAWKTLSDPAARRQYDDEQPGGGVAPDQQPESTAQVATKPVTLAFTRAWARRSPRYSRHGITLGLAIAAAASGGAITWGARSPHLLGTVIAAVWVAAAGGAVLLSRAPLHRALTWISGAGVLALALLGFAAYGQGQPGWVVWFWAGVLAIWTAAIDGIWQLTRGETP